MAVRSEEWVLFSFFLNSLCLLTPAAASGRAVSGARAALATLLFALLGLLQSMGPPALSLAPVVLLTPLPMAFVTFGRRGAVRMAFYTLLTGFLLSGLCAFLTAGGLPAWSLAPLCAAAAGGSVLLFRLRGAQRELTLRVTVNGVSSDIRAIVDTGNRLTDGRAGVVIVPRALLTLRDERLSGFANKGLCLLRANTVAGRTVMPAFWPDKMEIVRGKRRPKVRRARIALAPEGDRALIPPGLI